VDPYDELDSAVIHERAGELDDALAHYRAAESLAGADAWLLSEVLRRQAFVHHSRSEWEQSLALAERAAMTAEQGALGDQQAEALIAVGRVHAARGDFESASQALERVDALTADKRITGLALHNLGAIAAERGSWPLARQRFMESVQCFQAAGYHLGVAFAHNNYGRAALDHGNFALAADLLQHAVSTAKQVGEAELVALATMNSAEALAGNGEEARAQEMAASALAHFTATGNAWRRVECERLLGDLAKQRREEPTALQWWSGALDTARAIGAQVEIRKLEERLHAVEQ
jgi:tetratricopeptide (TPR) repeat protein